MQPSQNPGPIRVLTVDDHPALRFGYLLKNTVRKQLLDVIRAAHAGRRYVPPEVAQQIALHSAQEQLTERELSILRHVASGSANKQIAWEMHISEDTVKAHMKTIFQKLAVRDRTQAVATAIRRGMLSL